MSTLPNITAPATGGSPARRARLGATVEIWPCLRCGTKVARRWDSSGTYLGSSRADGTDHDTPEHYCDGTKRRTPHDY